MLTQKPRLVLVLLVASIPVFAQDQYEPFARAFAENYNSQNYEAIYNLCAEPFKAQVPKDYFSQILTATYTNAGKLNEIKLSENTSNGKIFHVVCEKATFALTVSLDASGKAAGLLIRPVQKYDGKDTATIIDQWKSNPANAGLVVGRIRNGQPDIQYYGVASKATSAPLDASSIFEIGSISKALTGLLLHTLIAEGKISLDDPVNKFLPEGSRLPKVKNKDILIRHLITHSSCLPRMPGNFNPPPAEVANPYNYYSPKDLLAFLPQVTPGECELGKTPEYSNLGAGLLGYILTKVSGKPYSELFNDRIAKPLKTKSLGVMGASDKWTQGHTPAGAPQPQWTFTDAIVGAGGVDANADDMFKLLSFLMKPDQTPLGKAVVASTVVQLPTPTMSFSTFWVRNVHASKTLIWHNGMTGGFNAFIGWVEGTQTGVFILSNNGEDVATNLGMTIMSEEK
jgi:D-alanyl-D-alanine-carboxypeptidase/D-alanyl-D-alanine-endopeptidase